MASVEPLVRNKHREPIDLSGAHIPRMSLSHTNLAESNFSKANLTEVNFQGSNLREADLRESNLTRANLTDADLRGANLASATLEGTDFSGAMLDEVDMSNANLSGALIEGVDLSTAKGLEWTQLLEARFDEMTVLPDYLEEENLFQLLEIYHSRYPWREKYTGQLNDLLAELGALKRPEGISIMNQLMQISVFEKMDEQDKGKRNE